MKSFVAIINHHSPDKKADVKCTAQTSTQLKDKLHRLEEIYFNHITTFTYQNFELREISQQHPIKRNLLTLFSANQKDAIHSGYCFQSAQVLYNTLVESGFSVSRSIARVLNGLDLNSKELLDLPATHLILVVELGQQRYLLDPSFTRAPVSISEHKNVSADNVYRCYLAAQDIYVLEKRNSKNGYNKLISTNFREASNQSIEFSMLQLARFPKKLSIRDELTIVEIATKKGKKSLYSHQPTKAFPEFFEHAGMIKQKKPSEEKPTITYTFAVTENDTVTKREITKLEEVCELLASEFGISHISEETLRNNITRQSLPLTPWTVDFPLDERELQKMAQRLPHKAEEQVTRPSYPHK